MHSPGRRHSPQELDDGVWEVDDAYAPDGGKYDLKLSPEILAIIERDLD